MTDRRRTCYVNDNVPRVDLTYDHILFCGATLHGAGGIMGSATRDGWTSVPERFRIAKAKKEMVRVYTVMTSDKQEFFDAPAVQCTLLAVYAPGYRR